MQQDQGGKREYNEKETSAILRRATELQALEERTSPGGGISLEQLQLAAGELGISPHLISRAAADVASGNMVHPNSFWHTPTMFRMESVVPNRISEDNWPMVLNKLRRVSGRVGDSVAIGKSFEWTSTSPDTFHVTVTPQGPQSHVSVASRFGEWKIMYYFLPLVAAFITSVGVANSTSFSGPVDAAVTLSIFASAFGLGHLGFRNLATVRRKAAQALMTVLETPLESAQVDVQANAPNTRPVAKYETSTTTESPSTDQVVQVLSSE